MVCGEKLCVPLDEVNQEKTHKIIKLKQLSIKDLLHSSKDTPNNDQGGLKVSRNDLIRTTMQDTNQSNEEVVRKPIDKGLLKKKITPSRLQNKDWRKSQEWYENGKRNECEIYQRKLIEEITGESCPKTSERINSETYELRVLRYPMKRDDAFDWTEDFDGKQSTSSRTIYYNLKMVVGKGGAQTRTLREVSHFVKAQLDYLCLSNNDNIAYFVNILDGDDSFRLYEKYYTILNKEKYKDIKDFVYIGDMHGFIDWFGQLNVR